MHIKFWLENQKGRDHLEDIRADDNIRMDLREIEWEGMGLMQLAPGRDQWRALVNAVMNLQVP
jgi:hypothetical protein